MSDWCILRTSAARTLPLAASLAESGYDVWTPSETVIRQKPRSKVRVERQAPMMPTFVFVRADRMLDLAAVLAQPSNPHPAFSIFRYAGRVPVIEGASMTYLRSAEDRGRQRQLSTTRHVVPVGDTIKMKDGAFAGLTGVVVASDGKAARVSFGGGFEVEIASWRLLPDQIDKAAPSKGTAARAAQAR